MVDSNPQPHKKGATYTPQTRFGDGAVVPTSAVVKYQVFPSHGSNPHSRKSIGYEGFFLFPHPQTEKIGCRQAGPISHHSWCFHKNSGYSSRQREQTLSDPPSKRE